MGPILYVPCNVLDTMECLPRTANESFTIPLLFKRRKKDKSNVYEDAIRPRKVVDDLRFLYNTSELWQETSLSEEKIKNMENGDNRLDSFLNECIGTSNGPNPNSEEMDEMETGNGSNIEGGNEPNDENEEDNIAGNLDTLISRTEILDLNKKTYFRPR